MTLRDVADRAGVSVRTVSNVVNDFPAVSDQTRAAVQLALDELGYRPNLAARQLRSGRTGVIGLLVPHLREQFFATLADAICTAGNARHLSVAVEQTQGDRDAELAPRATSQHLWDGAIVSALSVTEDDLSQQRTPLVVLGEHSAEFDLCWIGSDSKAAARDATAFLLETGRRRVAVIGHQRRAGGETGKLRTAGYRAAMRAAGLRVDRGWIIDADEYGPDQGYRGVAQLLDARRRPDAILCFNDELAFGALRALHDRGISVPDDIAVLGWDDVPQSAHSVPRLSTVAVPYREVAEAAVTELLAQIEHGRRTRTHVVIPHEIVARETT